MSAEGVIIRVALDGTKVTQSLNTLKATVQASTSQMKAEMQVFKNAGDQLGVLQAKHDGLTRTIKAQDIQIQKLVESYELAKASGDANSESVMKYANMINSARAKQESFKAQLDATRTAITEYNRGTSQMRDNLEIATKTTSAYVEKLQAQGKALQANKQEYIGLKDQMAERNRLIDAEKVKLQELIDTKGLDAKATKEQRLAVLELESAQATAMSRYKDLSRSVGSSSDLALAFRDNVGKLQDSIKGVGNKVSELGSGFTNLSLGIGVAFAYGINKATEFQKKMMDIQSLLQSDGTSQTVAKNITNKMNAQATQLSNKYGVKAEDVGTMYETMIRKGDTGQQALAQAEQMVKGSISSGVSLTDFSTGAMNLSEQFFGKAGSDKESATNATRMTNALTYASDHGAAKVPDLTVSGQYVGDYAKTLGYRPEDVFSQLEALSRRGIEGEAAGTGLRGVYATLAKPPKASANAMKQIGMQTVGSDGHLMGLPEIIDQLRNKLKFTTGKNGEVSLDAKSTKIVSQMFGRTSLPTITALMGTSGEELNAFAARTTQAEGKDYEGSVSDRMMQSAQNQFNKLKQSFTNLAMNISSLMLPTLVQVANAINGVFDKLNEASPATKKFIAGFALISAAVAPVLMIFGALIRSVSSILGLIKFLPTAFELLSGPIGWVVLGITALTAGFVLAYDKSKPFHDFIYGIGDSLKQGWSWIGKFSEAVKDLFSGTLSGTVKATSIMEKLGIDSKTQVQISKVVASFKGAFDDVGNAINGAIKWVGQFFTAIKDMFGGIDGVMKGTSIMNKLGLDPYQQKQISEAVGFIKTAFQSFKDAVKAVWGYIEPTLVKGMTTVWNAIQSGLSAIQKYWNQIFPELQPALDNLWKIVKFIIMDSLMPLWLAFRVAIGALANDWKTIWKGICDVIKTAWDFIVGACKIAWDMISGGFQVIIDLFSGRWAKAWTDMKGMVGNTLGDLWSMIKKVAGDIGNVFEDLGKAIANGILGGLAGGINAVADGINWVLDKVHAPANLRLPDNWQPPHFANGTVGDGHKGGLAVVGDGGKQELIQTPDGHTMLSPSTSTLMNLPKGTQVVDGHTTEKMMGLGLIPKYALGIGSLGNMLKSAWDWGKSKVSDLGNMGKNFWDLATHPSELIQTAIGNFAKLGSLAQPTLGIAQGAIETGAKGAVDWIKGLINGSPDNPNNSSVPTGSVSGTVLQWLTQAMQITNTPMSFLGALSQIAMHESGGNPHAINLWDSNALAGHPSKGLMQTIDSTFNQYGIPGLGDIWNPVANAVASIRYSNAVYGSIANVPGVRSLSSGRGYVGYANGTSYHNGGNAILGDGGEYEPYLTPQGIFGISPKVPTLFRNLPAGTKVWSSIQKMKQDIPFFANGTISRNIVPINGTDAIDGLLRVMSPSSSSSKPSGSHDNYDRQQLEAQLEGNDILRALVNMMGNMTMSVDGKIFGQLFAQYITAEQTKTTNRSNMLMGVRTV